MSLGEHVPNVVLCFYLILFNKAATSFAGRLCRLAAEGEAALVLQDWLDSFSVMQSHLKETTTTV